MKTTAARNSLILIPLATMACACALAQTDNTPTDWMRTHFFAKGTYKLLKDGDTAYLTLPGQNRPLTLELVTVSAGLPAPKTPVYAYRPPDGPPVFYHEMDSPDDPRFTGLYIVDLTVGQPQTRRQESPGVSNEPFPQSRPLQPLISLDGMWEARGKYSINISQSGDSLRVVELTQNSKDYGKQILEGRYAGEKSINVIAGLSDPPEHLTITVIDPDTLKLSNGLTFVRRTRPRINDFPCDKSNSFHVQKDGAVARLKAAIDAKDFSAMFCWASVGADFEDADSEYVTAMLLRRGVGTDKNPDLAFQWMYKSAWDGAIDAQTELAEMFEAGEGTKRDPQAAQVLRARVRERIAAEHFQEGMRHVLDLSEAVDNALGDAFGKTPYERCGIDDLALFSWKQQRHPLNADPCEGLPLKK